MIKKSSPVGVILVALLAAWFTLGKESRPQPAQQRTERGQPPALAFPEAREAGYGENEKAAHARNPYLSGPYQVSGVTVTDINTGRILTLGTVDLRPTLDRIAAGEKHSHRNDGSVFRNAGRLLPGRASGYYHEYVVPTPGVRGPGPQRLILGREGEIYYTADHYESFIRIDRNDGG